MSVGNTNKNAPTPISFQKLNMYGRNYWIRRLNSFANTILSVQFLHWKCSSHIVFNLKCSILKRNPYALATLGIWILHTVTGYIHYSQLHLIEDLVQEDCATSSFSSSTPKLLSSMLMWAQHHEECATIYISIRSSFVIIHQTQGCDPSLQVSVSPFNTLSLQFFLILMEFITRGFNNRRKWSYDIPPHFSDFLFSSLFFLHYHT